MKTLIMMRISLKMIFTLLLVLSMGAPSGVFAQQAISNCDESLSQEILDANNVRTRVYNNGALFWKGGQNLYEVPKGSGVNALFAGNIWIAGERLTVSLRSAQSTYGPYEFWAGPLDENGATLQRTVLHLMRCTMSDGLTYLLMKLQG